LVVYTFQVKLLLLEDIPPPTNEKNTDSETSLAVCLKVLEVLSLVVTGFSYRQIGELLAIREDVVKDQLWRAKQRIGLTTVIQLVVYAFQMKVLSLEEITLSSSAPGRSGARRTTTITDEEALLWNRVKTIIEEEGYTSGIRVFINGERYIYAGRYLLGPLEEIFLLNDEALRERLAAKVKGAPLRSNQLKRTLKQPILAGHFVPHTALPSESQLAIQHQMVQEGLVYREGGRVTFVGEAPNEDDVMQ